MFAASSKFCVRQCAWTAVITAAMVVQGIGIALAQTGPTPPPAARGPVLPPPSKEIYKYAPVPELGQFMYAPMGMFKPSMADQQTTSTYFGLHLTDIWPALHLQGADGNLYHYAMWVAHDPVTGALTAGKWGGIGVVTSAGVGPHPKATDWSGPVTQKMTSDGKIQYILGDGEQVVSYDDKSASWTSKDGQINVKGRLVAPGIGFLVPWRDPDGKTDMMYYVGQFYHVEGTFYGVKVSGGMTMDLQWGNEPYLDMWWVRNRQGFWSLFYTAFDDGSFDFGMFACGKYGARGAIATNDKGEELVNTTQMKLDIGKDQGGNLTSAVYTFGDGQKWEFIPASSARFPLPNGGKPPAGFTVQAGMKNVRQGLWMRVGEKRKPINAWDFFIDTADNGCDPSPGVP